MNDVVHISLRPSPEQILKLESLQALFSEACNALTPLVQSTRCWNRVALHHQAYRALREKFPQLGSQMACNAIYSVSRMSRVVYQHPRSPWNIVRLGERPLPLLQFLPASPVYFDRHTLSLKEGRLSMYTLDGRIHFHIDLRQEDAARFEREKLREIVLARQGDGYRLSFYFSASSGDEDEGRVSADLPEYLLVREREDVAVAEPAGRDVAGASARKASETHGN